MNNLGYGPILSFYLGVPGNATIAGSMAGTAAATLISTSISCSFAQSMEVFNMTGRNLELVLGVDNGTGAYTLTTPGATPITVGGNGQFFCPGTASSTPGSGRGNRFPVAISSGMKMWVRTTENTPITCATTTALIINLWA